MKGGTILVKISILKAQLRVEPPGGVSPYKTLLSTPPTPGDKTN